jgi:hypothetical protein
MPQPATGPALWLPRGRLSCPWISASLFVRRRYVHPMSRAILALLFSALSACVGTGDSVQSARFPRERSTLARYDGPTSEPSCGGAALSVYLRGEQVRHLDWTIETSTRLIRRQYYFDGTSPRLVVETIHARLDAHGDPLANPRLLSTARYPLDGAPSTKPQKEFLDHARFLVDDFKKHRKDFSRATNPNA